jgi:hypothetical protein
MVYLNFSWEMDDKALVPRKRDCELVLYCQVNFMSGFLLSESNLFLSLFLFSKTNKAKP